MKSKCFLFLLIIKTFSIHIVFFNLESKVRTITLLIWSSSHVLHSKVSLCWFYFAACVLAKSFQSCLTLCRPVDWSPPGSSVHGSLQARMLEWVAMPSSRRSSLSSDRTCVSHFLHWQASSLALSPPCCTLKDHCHEVENPLQCCSGQLIYWTCSPST